MVEETNELKALLAEVSKVEKPEKEEVKEPVIDVLDLPTRTEIHKTQAKRARLKVKSPVVRFVFLLLIISVIVFLAYYYLGDDIFIFKLN